MNRVCYFSSGYESPAQHREPQRCSSWGLPAEASRTGPPALLLPGKQTPAAPKVGQAKPQPSFQRRMEAAPSNRRSDEGRGRLSLPCLLLLPSPSLVVSPARATLLTGLGAQHCICSLRFDTPSGRRSRVAGKGKKFTGLKGKPLPFSCLTRKNLHLSHCALKTIF